MKRPVILILFVLCASMQAHSQTENLSVNIRYWVLMNDGNEYVGILREVTGDEIKLETESLGLITIPIVRISKIREVTSKNDTPLTDEIHSTKYFYNGSALNMTRGEGYYQNVWVLGNVIDYALTDNIQLQGGIVPLFLFDGTETPVWLKLKMTVPLVPNKFSIGGGVLYGTVIGLEENFGLINTMGTVGNKDKNLTLGLGWGFTDEDFGERPTISVSGMIRTGPRGYLVTDNMFLDTGEDEPVLLMLGGRRLISRVALDFGGMFISGTDPIVVVPWLGVTIPF